MNDILGAGTQSGAVSDVWSMWTVNWSLTKPLDLNLLKYFCVDTQ